jgi:hypothetical protein
MTVLPENFDSMSNFEKRLIPEKVLLHYNLIKKIEARLLFPKMRILDLSGNLLESTGNLFNKTLESSTKKENYNIDNLETFEMKKNKCEYMDWISRLHFSDILVGKCYSPLEMSGKSFSDCWPNHFYE